MGTCGNSATPDGARNALKPNTPASCRAAISVRSRTSAPTIPPQKPTSTAIRPAAAARFTASAATDVVGGMAFSGMSTIVVTPPAAAARVALANPSHSVRPGSLTWTWVSTAPGSRARSPRSVTPGLAWTASGRVTAVIRPPARWTAAGPTPSGVTTRDEHSISGRSGNSGSPGSPGSPAGGMVIRRRRHPGGRDPPGGPGPAAAPGPAAGSAPGAGHARSRHGPPPPLPGSPNRSPPPPPP